MRAAAPRRVLRGVLLQRHDPAPVFTHAREQDANWSTPQTVTFTTTRDSDKIDNAGRLLLSSAGIANAHVVISGSDGDRKGTDPVSAIQAPYNGQTVSGAVSFWGTAADSDGSITDVKFYVDGNRIAILSGASGTYRPPTWLSSSVVNGRHTLEVRSTDNPVIPDVLPLRSTCRTDSW